MAKTPTPYRRTAHIYDLIYEGAGKDYAAESARLRELIEERRPGATSLLDVACGTGGHLVHLRQWFDVVGADVDRGMLHEAHKSLPGIELVEADMRSLSLDRRFDAVTCLFSAIGHMPSEDDLGTAIATMARHLTPGGVLIVDGWVRSDAWIEGGVAFLDVAETDELKVARVGRCLRDGMTAHLEMHHLVGSRDGIEHIVERHELMLFEPAQYETAFIENGLVVEIVESPYETRDRYIGVRA